LKVPVDAVEEIIPWARKASVCSLYAYQPTAVSVPV